MNLSPGIMLRVVVVLALMYLAIFVLDGAALRWLAAITAAGFIGTLIP